MDKELIFVYNAAGDPFSLVIGYLHKKISPDTYKCNLCKLTYSVTMDPVWKEYIESLQYKVTFLHSDQFKLKYREYKETPLPTVFLRDEKGMRVIVSQSEMQQPKNINELIYLMKTKLTQLQNG